MLEARGIEATSGQLYSDVEGEIEEVETKPVITKIRVRYHLKGVSDDQREVVERMLGVHEGYCPAAASVKRGIAIECALDLDES